MAKKKSNLKTKKSVSKTSAKKKAIKKVSKKTLNSKKKTNSKSVKKSKNVKKTSKYFHDELNKIKNNYPKLIKEVRGVGLLIGLQLFNDPTKFIKKLQDNNFLTIRAAENTIRILPPLNVKKSEIATAIKIIKKVCKNF